MFDKYASWYLPLTPDLNSNPSFEEEDNEAEMPLDKHKTETLEESLVSFRLSRPNEQLSRFDQLDEELASSGDAAVHSSHRKPRRRFTRKEKVKKKMPEHNTDRKSRTDATPTPRIAMMALR